MYFISIKHMRKSTFSVT